MKENNSIDIFRKSMYIKKKKKNQGSNVVVLVFQNL